MYVAVYTVVFDLPFTFAVTLFGWFQFTRYTFICYSSFCCLLPRVYVTLVVIPVGYPVAPRLRSFWFVPILPFPHVHVCSVDLVVFYFGLVQFVLHFGCCSVTLLHTFTFTLPLHVFTFPFTFYILHLLQFLYQFFCSVPFWFPRYGVYVLTLRFADLVTPTPFTFVPFYLVLRYSHPFTGCCCPGSRSRSVPTLVGWLVGSVAHTFTFLLFCCC